MTRTPEQRKAARERAHASRDQIIRRYRKDESMNSLASAFGVSPGWLAARFDEWGEPRRDMAAAQALLRTARGARSHVGKAPHGE